MKANQMKLLECFEDEEDVEMTATTEFVQTMMYPGKKTQTVAETRALMYEKQKVKASSGLIPDQSSLPEHLKRAKLLTIIGVDVESKISITQTLQTMSGY